MPAPVRTSRRRTYLLCPPDHFAVEYSINPWMDPSAPVDTGLAGKQWSVLRDALVELGHEVHLLEPVPGLPDMVFAANGAFSVGGVVYGASFRYGPNALNFRASLTGVSPPVCRSVERRARAWVAAVPVIPQIFG